jgi:hypothetical protein
MRRHYVETSQNSRLFAAFGVFSRDNRHEWTNKSHYVQHGLNPLGRESAEELLTALLEDAVEVPLKRLIFERTGGNPFFIEEIVQADLRAGEFIYEHPAATATCRQTAAASGGSPPGTTTSTGHVG